VLVAARDYRDEVCYGKDDWPNATASVLRRPIAAAVSARVAAVKRSAAAAEVSV